jgi:hypothetical protein
MTAQEPRSRQPKQLDAGTFQAEISSFALRLAAEGKAVKTIRTYTEAVQWFAAARLPGRASWEQVGSQPGHPAVDDLAAGPLQQRLRQQPVVERRPGFLWFGLFAALAVPMGNLGEAG